MITIKKLKRYIKNPSEFVVFFGRYPIGHLFTDKFYLKHRFRVELGKKLDLKHPKTYNEKLQWLKLYDRRPEYCKMVDKYEAKQYVAEKIGAEYVVPNFGVWERFEDIDFDALPKQFVLKCTHDCGGLVICKDKSKLDIDAARAKINHCLKRNYYWTSREWPYKNVPPRIIAEKYIGEGFSNGLIDYKFYCFDGKVRFLYVSEGLEDHATAQISFLTKEWEFAEFQRLDYETHATLPEKPEHYDKMLQLAEQLSVGHTFLRVDLYEVQGQIYFSELTFTPCSGYMPFEPKEWDEKIGGWIKLPTKEK